MGRWFLGQLWSGGAASVQATWDPKTSATPSRISAKLTIKLCSQSPTAEKGESCNLPQQLGKHKSSQRLIISFYPIWIGQNPRYKHILWPQ